MTEEAQHRNTNLEGDIETANIKVALAKGREALDEAFDLVSELIERVPSDRKIYEIAKRLGHKDESLVPQLRRIYRSKNIPFMEDASENFTKVMRQTIEAGDFDGAQQIYREAEAQGLADAPDIRERFERAQSQYQQESQGIVVPPEIRVKYMRARSTYRGFDYTTCIDLCTEGLGLLEKIRRQLNDASYQYLQKELADQLEQAQFMLDRRNVLLEAFGRVNKGNWEEARDLFREALRSFPGDEVFEKEIEKLDRVLANEAEIEYKLGQLRTDIADVETLLTIERNLLSLPIKLSASASPTDRQRRIRDDLKKVKEAMVTQFKKVGKRNLELHVTKSSYDDKQIMLSEAKDYLQAVERLDPDDIDTSPLLTDVMRALHQIDEAKMRQLRRATTTKSVQRLLRSVAILITIIVLIATAVYAASGVFDAIERTRVANEQTAIAAQNATGTAVINIAALTANAESTNMVMQQIIDRRTQEAQSTLFAITAVARSTDIILTANASTAEAQRTQQSIEFALMTATQASFNAQMDLLRTQEAATATISYIQTATASAPTFTNTPTPLPTATATPLYACQGIVTITQGINVRARPSVNSPAVGSVLNGSIVEIYQFIESTNSNIGGWYQIVFVSTTGASQGGWIASDYVAPIGCPEEFSN